MISMKHLINEGKPTGEFVRFGGLSPVKQKGFANSEDASFHSPPARKGIYAFPKGYIELFLLGGGYGDPNKKGSANRFVYVKDTKGNKVTSEHPDFKKYDENDNYWHIELGLKDGAVPDEDGDYAYDDKIHALVKRVHPKRFTYSGQIWHHHKEFVNPHEILKEKGAWVKTSMKVYLDAFAKNAHSAKKEMRRMQTSFNDGKFDISNADAASDPLEYFSKDHLEVFIERLK